MIGILIVTILAFLLGLIIVLLEAKLENDNIQAKNFLKLLPGFNCGSCGFGSCKGMAEAMCENIDNYKKCRPLKNEQLHKMEEYIEKLKVH